MPPVSTAKYDSSYKNATGAETQVRKAQGDFDRVTRQVASGAKSSGGLAAAEAALAAAQSEHDAADAAVERQLSGNADFRAATAAVSEGEKRLSLGTADAVDVLFLRSRVSQMRATAEAADPKVAETKARLVAAQTRVTQIRASIAQAVPSDPQWIAARRALDEAKARRIEANKNLALEADRLAAAQAARNNALRGRSSARTGYANHRTVRVGRR